MNNFTYQMNTDPIATCTLQIESYMLGMGITCEVSITQTVVYPGYLTPMGHVVLQDGQSIDITDSLPGLMRNKLTNEELQRIGQTIKENANYE